MRRLALLLGPALLFLGLFLVVPVGSLLRVSLYETSRSFGGRGWSLGHYAHFLGDGFYLGVLGETLLDGAIVTLGTLVLGFPVGYALARMEPGPRRWRMLLVILPLSLSLVVNVFGWLVILGRAGMVNDLLMTLGLVEAPIQLLFSRPAMLLVLGQTFLPFQILSIMSVVAQIDPALEQAAANLRAGRWTTFRRVVLPLARPGILAGSIIVFSLTVSAFVTPRIIGGSRLPLLGSLIYEQILVLLNWPFGCAMAFILLVIVLGLTALVNRLGQRRAPAEGA